MRMLKYDAFDAIFYIQRTQIVLAGLEPEHPNKMFRNATHIKDLVILVTRSIRASPSRQLT